MAQFMFNGRASDNVTSLSVIFAKSSGQVSSCVMERDHDTTL